jgi:hypothetical protein
MKKTVVLVIVSLLMNVVLFAEDIHFRTIKNTPVWQGSFYTNDRILFELSKDTIVIGVSGALIDGNYERDRTPFQDFIYENEEYTTYIESLIPDGTDDLFPKELITGNISNAKKHLIFSYYLEALSVKNRDVIFNKDTLFWEWFVKQPAREPYEERDKWWKFVWILYDNNFLIYNTTLKLTNEPYYTLDLLVKNIRKHEKSYYVNVKMRDEKRYHYLHEVDKPLWKNTPISKIPKPSQREFFDLIIVPDGDYLDVYVDNYNTHFATFVYVDKQLMEELTKLIDTGTCNDLTNIPWPRRADGSMDYPPPSLANNMEETENYDDSATAEFAKEKPTNKGSGFKIIMIAGIALLLGGGATAFVVMKRK